MRDHGDDGCLQIVQSDKPVAQVTLTPQIIAEQRIKIGDANL